LRFCGGDKISRKEDEKMRVMEIRSLERVEDAALNAWPAPKQMVYDGWLLRFTGGESKRVNSINVRYRSTLPLAEKIAHCEEIFTRNNLPVIFRLPEPLTEPDIYRALSDAGYILFYSTLVLGCKIIIDPAELVGVDVRAMPQPDWLALRAELSHMPAAHRAIYRTILDGIVPEKKLLGLFLDGNPVACGMGVREGDLLGFFSIYTSEAHRRRGLGQTMMTALTQWGQAQGATYGYLQVEGDNTPAQALYEKLGFKMLYRYSYAKRSS